MKEKTDAIYGAIAGDIIGSSYEFKGSISRDTDIEFFRMFSRFTDDTVMTIAVADWLLGGELRGELQEKLIEYGRSYPNVGYGRGFNKWLHSVNPEPYESCGNGSAMRVSAVGCMAHSLIEALELAKESAMPTHNHPEGIKGAQATAAAIYLARTGKTKEEMKTILKSLVDYPLDIEYEYLHNKPYEFHALCQDTVPEALVCFFKSDSYEDCIRKAMLTNKDTDTAACIAGAVAAAYYGMPEDIKNRVYDYIPEAFVEIIDKIALKK